MTNHAEETWDDLDLEIEGDEGDALIKPTARVAALGWGLLSVTTLIGALFGWCHLYARYLFEPMALGRMLLDFGVYTLALYAVIVWPLINMAYPALVQKFSSSAVRILVFACYLWPPVLAYSYYRGGTYQLFDLQELLLISVPPALIAASILENTRKGMLVTLFFSLATFVPLFVINDVLSPLSTVFAYASDGPRFYYWRTLAPLIAAMVSLVSLAKLRKSQQKVSSDGCAVTLAGLAVFSLIQKVLLPLAVATFTHNTVVPNPEIAYDVLVYGLAFALLYRPNPTTYAGLLLLSAITVLFTAFSMFQYLQTAESTFWDLFAFSYLCARVLGFGWILFSLCQMPNRSLFRLKYVANS